MTPRIYATPEEYRHYLGTLTTPALKDQLTATTARLAGCVTNLTNAPEDFTGLYLPPAVGEATHLKMLLDELSWRLGADAGTAAGGVQ
jgi:hypothetical protein